ncbi:MAG: alkaline phosphatase family protein, partial [Thermoleophilaceae bacterium]|nr:alkaline phosphatase family protein [Thermoleophilaceae bacterium]
MRIALALLLALFAAATAHAATPRPLVYVLVLDGTDGDRYDQGTLPNVRALGGTYFKESRASIVAETNPNHVSMATGAYIDKSGVAGNAFAIYQPLKANSCEGTGAADEAKPPTETSGEGASCLLAETVFQAVKRQGNPDGLVTAGVFGKPKLGSIFAGRELDGKNPDADHLWAPCSSSLQGDEDYCKNVQTNPGTGYAVDDKTVMDEIVRITRQGVKADGRTKRPDLV